ncbi:UNVERIFIED_ORG: threonine/homoserine/homoserine lactone efflux protein [Rhizobium esperanzae]
MRVLRSALAAAFGLSQLFLTLPVAYDAVRWAGCSYLLYLAYKTSSRLLPP